MDDSESDHSCSEPDIEEGDTLSYETLHFDHLDEEWIGIYLFTQRDQLSEIDLIDERDLSTEARQWIDETDFTQNSILAIQVVSSTDSSELQPIEVTREEIIGEHDSYKMHAYTCISDPGDDENRKRSARLLRVSNDGKAPSDADLTHWEGDNSVFYA
ncbi:hypothetical protein [Natronorubrum sp. DTA28]|uniref:hypothetical protein n=1 Tax=Natronorubrum sp. DTA28 TaxID=3447019 RepID=UPI003F83BE6A